jgi:hypothetical protein
MTFISSKSSTEHLTAELAGRRRVRTAKKPLLYPSRSLLYSPHHPFGSGFGTIYNNRTLEPFKELGLDSQRVKKLASKLHVHQ